MTIHIPITDLSERIKRLYLEDKIRSITIDYAPNHLTGWYNDEELCMVDFNPIMKMDNRYRSYEIYLNPTEIIIEIL